MNKVIEVRRETVEADTGKKFSFVDPNGMTWFGDCRAVDYGPNDYYAVTGKVTSGPAEWVGLNVKLSGQYEAPYLELKPDY